MLADIIKEKTAGHHQGLEKKIVLKLKNLNSREDYLQILQLFYGYFGGLEDRINTYINTKTLPDYNERRKTEAIADDIHALGGQPVQKAVNGSLPEIVNPLQAMGALYVIEGSTLGGSIISKMVSSKLGLDNGLTFFNGYGANTPQMWETFRHELNRQGTAEADQHAIIDSANNTFLKFNNWIEQHG